jgi:LysR family transcriptional regulator, hydrogen peroxide-inducible genes activator
MPNIRQLEYLVAVADTLNFRQAAERTGSTQPTLSEQLQTLEARLGAQLVERDRTKVLLTPVGAQVVDIARRILNDVAEMRGITAGGGRELTGLLRLGVPATIGPYLLPLLMPLLHRQYPDLRLYVREELPQMLSRALADGHLDVIISLLPVPGKEFVAIELFREPLWLTVAADHPLARKSHVRREDLAGEDVLTLGPGHQLHGAVLAICEEFGARLRFDFESSSLATLRATVIMGLGITFFPELYVNSEIRNDPNLKVMPLEGRSFHRTVGLIWRRTSSRSTDYERLADIIPAALSCGELADRLKWLRPPPNARPPAAPGAA